MKALLKEAVIFTIFAFLLLPVPLFATADSVPENKEIWIRARDRCNQGLYLQPNGPVAVMLFCEDAVGDYIGLVYYGHMEAPTPLDFVRKLSEAEKKSFYSIWSLGNRMWQEPIWASDLTSYAWGPDGTKLYIATSEIYGAGGLYELDLIRKKYKQIAPAGRVAKLNDPGPGYIIMQIDKDKSSLIYIEDPQSDAPLEGEQKFFYKIK